MVADGVLATALGRNSNVIVDCVEMNESFYGTIGTPKECDERGKLCSGKMRVGGYPLYS
jgi:hypothetical protein